MAERVVECLEIVQVDEQQRATTVVAATGGQSLLEPVCQKAAVGQAGELVEESQILDFLLGPFAQGDVLNACDVVCDRSTIVAYGRDRQPCRIFASVLAAIPYFALPETDRIESALEGDEELCGMAA